MSRELLYVHHHDMKNVSYRLPWLQPNKRFLPPCI